MAGNREELLDIKDNKKLMDEVIATVTGISNKGHPISFKMSRREIKHIRRCARLYLNIHPILNDDEQENNLSSKAIEKFTLFGKPRRRSSSEILKKRLSSKETVCSFEGCNIKENLTIDHIIPVSADGDNEEDNLQWMCEPHHRVKEIEYWLWRKEKEVVRLKQNKQKLLKDAKVKNEI